MENYREDGHHRQRVVAHLGHHDAPEAALEDARDKLKALDNSKLFSQAHNYKRMAENRARVLRNPDNGYFRGIEAYHGGEIPTLEEADALAGESEKAPFTDEYDKEIEAKWGMKIYNRERRERTPEQVAYCEAFKDGEWRETWGSKPDEHGYMFVHSGFASFHWYLREYNHGKARANKKILEFNRKREALQERIAKLESVVTN